MIRKDENNILDIKWDGGEKARELRNTSFKV